MNTRMKLALSGSLLLLALLVADYKTTAQRQPDSSANQPQERVIVMKLDFTPPVRITTIKTKKGVIEPDKPYPDNDDWLKGLTVLLDNESGKNLTYIDVEVLFHRPDNQAYEPPGVWHLEYGEDPFRYTSGEAVPPVRVKPIEHSDTFEIRLSDHDFDQLGVFLRDAKYSVVRGVEVRVNVIGFSDGTAWNGRMIRRDPSSPIGWSPIEPPGHEPSQIKQPQGSARKGTADFLKIAFKYSTEREP